MWEAWRGAKYYNTEHALDGSCSLPHILETNVLVVVVEHALNPHTNNSGLKKSLFYLRDRWWWGEESPSRLDRFSSFLRSVSSTWPRSDLYLPECLSLVCLSLSSSGFESDLLSGIFSLLCPSWSFSLDSFRFRWFLLWSSSVSGLDERPSLSEDL